jgi:hypothetical protein
MNAVVKPADQLPASLEPSTLLQIISRAASDPTVDIEKMERLMAMHERIVLKQAEAAFNQAMRECQGEMRPISADAENPQTRSKYATYAKLDRVLRPIYTKHGFSLSFDEGDAPADKPDHVRVLCYVAHDSGFTRTYKRDMPADGKGAKGGDVMTKTHASGAAHSYGARYILKGAFNIAVGEEDKDGNDPNEPTLNEKQLADLKAVLTEVGADIPKFLKYIKCERLEDIYSRNYEAVLKMAQAKRRQPK